MKDIAHRLNAYVQKHSFDSGDSDPAEIGDGFKELEESAHLAVG